MQLKLILIASLLAGGTAAASAQDVGQHPAVFAPRQLPGVDPSIFIVGHPASPRWRLEHENSEHPAVVVKRGWVHRRIDGNTFLVQPPAHARWIEADGVNIPAVATSTLDVPGS